MLAGFVAFGSKDAVIRSKYRGPSTASLRDCAEDDGDFE